MITKQGLIFNIQRYCVHDGSGIRTMIFFKGCPLRCPWCSNPESRGAAKPSTWFKNDKSEIIGKYYHVDDIVHEVMKDEVFFRTSGGGVTLSGGEVLMQADFLVELLKRFQEYGVHTAIETSGCCDKKTLQKILPFCNQILFDLKIMDKIASSNIIGADIETIKENFELALAQDTIKVIPRIPLIPEYTATYANILAIIDYLKSLGISEVHLLPFHQYGSKKYEYLNWQYILQDVDSLSKEATIKIQDIFESHSISTVVNGL